MLPPVKKLIHFVVPSHRNPPTPLFKTVFNCKRYMICAYFAPDSDNMTFSLEKALLWIEDSYFSRKFEVESVLMMDLFLTNNSFSLHKMLTDGHEFCGLFVDYCDVFISCLDSHSDGTHSLQRICWWASDVMLNFSKSVPMKKLTHISDGLGASAFSISHVICHQRILFVFSWCQICLM